MLQNFHQSQLTNSNGGSALVSPPLLQSEVARDLSWFTMAASQLVIAVMPVKGLCAHISSISIDASNCWLVPVLEQTNLLLP